MLLMFLPARKCGAYNYHYCISKGCGFILGPTLGGGLYDVGGFILPFAIVGAMMLIGKKKINQAQRPDLAKVLPIVKYFVK